MAIIAKTARLCIRTWEHADIEKLCRLTREPGIGDFSISSYSNFSPEHAKRWIETEIDRYQKRGLGRFAVTAAGTLSNSNEILGISGIFEMIPPDEDHVEINYRYPICFRGKGYATEAAQAILGYGFNQLNLGSIDAVTLPQNAPSKRILNRLGFREIGKLKYQNEIWERWRANP